MGEQQAAVLVPRASDPVALRPTPEYGPLVRTQALRSRAASSSLPWFFAGFGAIKLAQVYLGPFAAEFALLVGILGAVAVADRVPVWWRRLRMGRCPAWDGTGTAPAGAVRIRGRVRALGKPFTVPGESSPVIFAHTLHPQARVDGTRGKFQREDVRGLVLEIELATDVAVRIASESVRLVGSEATVPEVGHVVRRNLGAPWAGWLRGKLTRRTLRESDQVEAVGQLVRDVNVQGEASPGRGVPMLHWLMPAWRGGVWIRRIGGG